MVAFTYRMDVGFPGTTNRNHDSTVLPEVIDSADPPMAYGIGVVIDPVSGQIRPPNADIGHTMACTVTASNALGSTAAPPSNGVVVV